MPSESTPLISKGRYAFERLGIDSREVWSIIIIVLLFIGKGVQPFVTDIVHVTQAALIEDKTLDITFTALGGLVGVQDFTSGVGELWVPIVLRNFGPRNVYLTLDAQQLVGSMLGAYVAEAPRGNYAHGDCSLQHARALHSELHSRAS